MCLEDEVEEIGLGWDVSFEWNGMERDEDRSIVCFKRAFIIQTNGDRLF